jgi:GrpB-like predicted nucleotidyltransferase (UPF0157 family)
MFAPEVLEPAVERLAELAGQGRDPGLVQRYAALQKTLASQYVTDREAYTAGKADFIAAVLGRVAKTS